MSNSKNKAKCLLFDQIPRAALESYQIATTQEGDVLSTFRFLRAPATIDELEGYKNDGIVCSMDKGTLLLLNFHDDSRYSCRANGRVLQVFSNPLSVR